MKRPCSSRFSRGFGLSEMMIAMTIGLMLVLAMTEVYVVMTRGEQSLAGLSHLQDSARFASERIRRDLRMAGFYGGTYQRWNLEETADADFQLPALAGECFQANNAQASFRWATPITRVGIGLVPPAAYGWELAAGPFTNCVTAGGGLAANSDVLAIHLAGPDEVTLAELAGGRYYVQSSILEVFGFFCPVGNSGAACVPADTPAAITGTAFYELVSRVYYVRPFARAAGDGIPTLMMTELQGNTIVSQPLVEGVEVFRVLWGLDSIGDGNVDRYLTASEIGDLNVGNVPEWLRTKSAIVSLVVRTPNMDPSRLTDDPADRVFTIGGIDYAVDGRFMSRLYEVSAALRNPGHRGGGI